MRYLKLNISKNMRIKALIPAILTTVFVAPAMATDQYSDTARVISATPQTERVNMPRQECRTEYQQQSYNYGGDRSIAGAVIGGIAGGLLGNTIGRGKGRIAAAAVGAGIGAITGDRIGNQNNTTATRSVPVQNCYQVDNWQTVNAGYLVTYEYNGRSYTTVTNSHPGQYIDVNVAVSPSNHAVTQIGFTERNQYNDSRWDNNAHHEHDKHRGWNRHHEGFYY